MNRIKCEKDLKNSTVAPYTALPKKWTRDFYMIRASLKLQSSFAVARAGSDPAVASAIPSALGKQ
jgi:hypothetical protein